MSPSAWLPEGAKWERVILAALWACRDDGHDIRAILSRLTEETPDDD